MMDEILYAALYMGKSLIPWRLSALMITHVQAREQWKACVHERESPFPLWCVCSSQKYLMSGLSWLVVAFRSYCHSWLSAYFGDAALFALAHPTKLGLVEAVFAGTAIVTLTSVTLAAAN